LENSLDANIAHNISALRSLNLSDSQLQNMLTLARRDYYRDKPLEYFYDKLGAIPESIDWSLIPEYKNYQWDGTPNPLAAIANAVVKKQWVAVKGAVSTGKTVFMAMLALWFYDNFENSIVITSAPKEGQLALNIWKWIPQFFQRLPRGSGVMDTLRIRRWQGNDSWMILGYGAGITAAERQGAATKFQSIHAPNMLFIVEETPGFPEEALAAYENTCSSPNNIIVAVGNPNSVNDTLCKFAKRNPPRGICDVTISGLDFPNVVLKNPKFIEGGQTEDGLAQLADKYRRVNHPLYLSRARGIAPEQPSDAAIRWDWCVEAARRDPNEALGDTLAIGADVANSEDGDEASICEGKGSHCLTVESFKCPNSNELGARLVQRAKIKNIKPERVAVDGVGVGAGTVNEARRLKFNIVDIQSASKPVSWVKDRGVRMNERFNNLRSQMWWMAKVDLALNRTRVELKRIQELPVGWNT
jgi:hypothetical protein